MRVKPGEAAQNALEHEILGEQASTIGRLAHELGAALDALRAFDEKVKSGRISEERRERQRPRLVDAAAYALWNFVVQRDCAGFRFTDKALQQFTIPKEVRVKMGTVRPKQT